MESTEIRKTKPIEMKRHPFAVAWDAWIESEEGKRCADGTASGVYLLNRLQRAFMAGAETGAKKD